MNRPKIFFSYSRYDSAFALKLAKDLRESGADVWIDQLDIQAGKHWDAAVEKALDDSSYVIVILTPTSIVSENVMDEVAFALDSGKKIIPVLLVQCPTPLRLRRLQRVDFTEDYEAGLTQLKKSIYPSYSLRKSLSRSINSPISAEPSNRNTLSPDTRKKFSAFKKVMAVSLSIAAFCIVFMSFIKLNSGNEELKAWNDALMKDDSLAYALFMQRFPDGAYTTQAKRKSDSLMTMPQHVNDTMFQSNEAVMVKNDTAQQVIEETKKDSIVKNAIVSKPKPTYSNTKASFKTGQYYQGGIIIYVTSTGDHGLIASLKEESNINWETAKRKSSVYKSEGYSDWRLPTKAELNRMYNAKKHFEKPLKGLYWSSTEENGETAWVQNFTNGNQANSNKTSMLQMRAVRTF